MRDAALAQLREDLLGAGQRAALVEREQLAEQAVVDLLQLGRLLVAELVADLAADRAREQPAAHPDLAVDAPAVDRHPGLVQGLLPGEDVGVDGVDEGAVEVEDQRRHQPPDGRGTLARMATAALTAARRAKPDVPKVRPRRSPLEPSRHPKRDSPFIFGCVLVAAALASLVIGHSVQGREIRATRVGEEGAPVNVLVVGNVHGNETAGEAIVAALRRERIDGVALWLVRTGNPDGRAARHAAERARRRPQPQLPLALADRAARHVLPRPDGRARSPRRRR